MESNRSLFLGFPWVKDSNGVWHATNALRNGLLCGETLEVLAGRQQAPQPGEPDHKQCLALKVIELCDAELAKQHGLPIPKPEPF